MGSPESQQRDRREYMSAMTSSSSEQARLARAELEPIVTSLNLPKLLQLVIMGRFCLDERRLLPPGEQARLARVELEWIAGALPLDELQLLVRRARELLNEPTIEPGSGPAPRGWDYVG